MRNFGKILPRNFGGIPRKKCFISSNFVFREMTRYPFRGHPSHNTDVSTTGLSSKVNFPLLRSLRPKWQFSYTDIYNQPTHVFHSTASKVPDGKYSFDNCLDNNNVPWSFAVFRSPYRIPAASVLIKTAYLRVHSNTSLWVLWAYRKCKWAYLSVPFSILRFLRLSSLFSSSLFRRTASSSRSPVLLRKQLNGTGSVLDPWHFGTDPDPNQRIRASDQWIRILLFSPLTFKTPTKTYFFLSFSAVYFLKVHVHLHHCGWDLA